MKRIPLLLLVVLALPAHGRAQSAEPLVHEAVVDAPVEDVWAAFTTGEGLRSWMAPHAEIDLRIGGLMRSNYNAQGSLADASTIENRVLAFDPRRMFAMQVAKPPAEFPFPAAIRQMWTIVYFDAVGPRQTRVRTVGLGFGADEESRKMRAFFDRGNAATLTGLQRRFAEPAAR
jgi:uncharacterized protein YndB with AHSA1/START domain